jgi:phage shock protein PspC (stress-responsive transcriptional regulator)
MAFCLLGLLILLKVPFLGNPLPLLSSELERMLVGEKLNLNLNLYSEVFTEIGPLSAFFYKVVNLFFGKSKLAYETLAGVFLILQTWFFVYMVNKRNLLNEKNYISGLIFLVVCHASFEFAKLTPSLMANFFVLLSLNAVLRQLEKRENAGEDVLEAGVFLGIATLFDISNFLLIIWVIAALFFFTRTTIRQSVMVLLAFALPLFLSYLFYYFNGQSAAFLELWLFNLSPNFKFSWLVLKDVILAYLVPFVIGTFGIIRVFRGARYNNLQNRSHQILLLFGLFVIPTLFIANEFYPSALFTMCIPISFFCTGFFVHQKKMIVPELMFLAFIAIILIPMYLGATSKDVNVQALKSYRVNTTKSDPRIEGKRIFITGEQTETYKNTSIATGYLSWNLARRDFENPNNFMSLVSIYNNFTKDLPEVIIDEKNVMPDIFDNLPDLAKRYRKEENRYFLK